MAGQIKSSNSVDSLDRQREFGESPGSRALAVVNARALADIMPMAEAINLMTIAMQELSAGMVTAPERWGMSVGAEGKLVLMPGVMPHIGSFGLKVLSLFPNAAANGLHGHQGLVLLFDTENGRLLCAVDSHAVTGLRTAAASAAATRILARAESRSLALIGCGDLARLHADAISLVRPIDEIIVWGRSMEKAARFAEYCRARLSARLIIAGTVREAVERADIICTVTSSPLPVLEGQWLKPGQHLNLVGSSTRASREVDDEAVARGLFVVDSRPHALSQAGELRHAIEQGHVDENHVAAEIGEVLAGKAPGRSSAAMITTYKSLGHVAQDIRLIDTVYNRLGQSAHVVYVPW